MSLKATRLSRLLEGDTGIGLSRLQGYQGYWRGRFLKATRLSRLHEGDAGIGALADFGIL